MNKDNPSITNDSNIDQISIPSYLTKIHFGAFLNRTLQESTDEPKSKEEAKQNLITQLSTLGIIGNNPNLFTHDEEYVSKLINLFQNKPMDKALPYLNNPSTSSANNQSSTHSGGGHTQSHPDDDDVAAASDHDDDSLIDRTTIEDNKKSSSILDDTTTGLYSPLSSPTARIPLPSRWIQPKDSHFEMTSDGLQISAKNLVKPVPSSSGSSSIGFNSQNHKNTYFVAKANYNVSREVGMYYYEIEIKFGLKSGAEISIGFTDGDSGSDDVANGNSRLEDVSWNYNGKGGKLICHEDGRNLVKNTCKFGDKDTVGIGVNFINNTLFVTKNGAFLGEACNLPSDIDSVTPVVSFAQWNAISTNFGLGQSSDNKFRFNIDNYVESFKYKFFKKINQLKVPTLTLKNGLKIDDDDDLKILINKLIGNYFNYMGYIDSLRSFQKDLQLETGAEENSADKTDIEDNLVHKEAEVKKQIKTLVMSNEIDKVIKLINSSYPDILKSNKKIGFRLQCLKLVNMISEGRVDQSIRYARKLKHEFTSKSYANYLNQITSLLALENPRQSQFFKNFNTFEKLKLIDNLMNLINVKNGVSIESNFDKLVLKLDQNLVSFTARNRHGSIDDKTASNDALLIDLLDDFIKL